MTLSGIAPKRRINFGGVFGTSKLAWVFHASFVFRRVGVSIGRTVSDNVRDERFVFADAYFLKESGKELSGFSRNRETQLNVIDP